MGEWSNDNTDDVEYDGDNDNDEMTRQTKNSPIPALRLQGGAPVVETVTEEENKDKRTEHKLHQPNINRITNTTTIIKIMVIMITTTK